MAGNRFVKGTERLVDPITVGSSHFMQRLLEALPRRVQRRVVEGASQRSSRMGFVVEPYALFAFFRVRDEERAARLLPDGFRLVRTRVFEGDEPACYAVMSFFRAHTSVFWGARAEFYLVAEDEGTGLLSWVMIDYLSDTIGYDRAHGLRGPSAPGTVITTTAGGSVVVDLHDESKSRGVELEASLDGAPMRSLDERLWIEGNLSVAYGPLLSPGDAGVFSLTFPAEEMASALEVPVSNVRVGHVSWHSDVIESQPSQVACFPYAQHLLSDSPGASSGHASRDELERAVEAVDFASIPRFGEPSASGRAMRGAAVALGACVALALTMALG